MAKVHLTTLEEDMRAIGLLPSGSKRLPQTESTEGAAPSETPSASVDEARAVRVKHKTSSERGAARKAYKKNRAKIKLRNKKYRKSAGGKKAMAKHTKILKKIGGPIKGKRIQTSSVEPTGMDRVTKLAEDVADIVSSIGGKDKKEVVKGFANLALAADALSKNLKLAANDLGEGALLDLGVTYDEMAEQAAEIATALSEGEDIDQDELEEMFRESMEDLLEGMEIYDEACSEPDDDEMEPDEDDMEECGDEEDSATMKVEKKKAKKA
jgi:hypothetical protein